MKEASGELNMTVVTIVAIAAVGALFYFVVLPIIQSSVATQSCKSYGDGWHAVKHGTTTTNNDAKVNKWACCPKGVTTYDSTQCVD